MKKISEKGSNVNLIVVLPTSAAVAEMTKSLFVAPADILPSVITDELVDDALGLNGGSPPVMVNAIFFVSPTTYVVSNIL